MNTRVTLVITLSLLAAACGQQSEGRENYWRDSSIVGGAEVAADDAVAKHIVALKLTLASTGQSAICTGSIVASDLVLTAAHCLPEGEGDTLEVLFGRNIVGRQASQAVQKRSVIKLKAHEGYKADSEDALETNDIALVRFSGGLPEGYKSIGILSTQGSIKTKDSVLLAGYGVSNGFTGTGSGVLRKVKAVVDDPAYSAHEVSLDQSSGRGACYGDSGGPAFIEANNRLYLWGVTSRGENGCVSQSVYTNASTYLAWIRTTAKELRAQAN